MAKSSGPFETLIKNLLTRHSLADDMKSFARKGNADKLYNSLGNIFNDINNEKYFISTAYDSNMKNVVLKKLNLLKRKVELNALDTKEMDLSLVLSAIDAVKIYDKSLSKESLIYFNKIYHKYNYEK